MGKKEKNKKVSGNTLMRLLKFTNPYKTQFLLLVFLTIVIAAITPLTPYLIQYTIDNHIANFDKEGLIQVIIILFVLLIIQVWTRYSHTYLSAWLGQSIIKDIRVKLYQHILRFRLKFYDNTPIGRLVTRCISDIETLADVFSQGIAALIADVLTLLFIVIIMFWTNWKLAIASLATLPLLILATYVFKEKIKVTFTMVRNAVSNLNTFAQEHITGMSIVQVFNAENREYNKFKNINQQHLTANIKSVLYYSIYFPVAEVTQALGIGFLIWYASKEMLDGGELQPGIVIAFIMYIQLFFRPIRQIADRFNTLQMGVVSTERILKLLDSDDDILKEKNETLKKDQIKGAITFKNVSFAYNEGEWVLKNINFSILPGETWAIVGATGAGKSSIINLINRFYEIQKGEILIDGVSISEYTLQSLRENIGVVLQNVFLFSNSIQRNIDLGNEKIPLDKIKKTAKMVGADRFISQMPNDYSFNVQERGSLISGGQRQLLSFVRAMIYDPKILILDEATASIDSETEELIQNTIRDLMKDRTSIVIAHRLSTIKNANRIIVLDKGEIVEIGTHLELLKKKNHYAKLYEMQFKDIQ